MTQLLPCEEVIALKSGEIYLSACFEVGTRESWSSRYGYMILAAAFMVGNGPA